jgi:hypothetical protein
MSCTGLEASSSRGVSATDVSQRSLACALEETTLQHLLILLTKPSLQFTLLTTQNSSRIMQPIIANENPEIVAGHEVGGNSLTRPATEADLKPGPRTVEGGLHPSAGQKHELDSFSSEISHKKHRLDPSSSDSLQAQLASSCPVCSRPCWWCNIPDALPRIPSPVINNDPESMDSSDPTIPSGLSRSSSQQKKEKRDREDGRKYLAPKDDGFELHILGQCGVQIDSNSPLATSTSIFGTPTRPTTNSRVFLNPNIDEMREIARDFEVHYTRTYDENSLALLAADSLVLRDRYTGRYDAKALLSLRRDRWRPSIAGPEIPSHTHYYDWAVEPDVTYAVSINMFDLELRKQMAKSIGSSLFAEPDGVCPYLTVEYKSTEKGGRRSDAQNQVAAASVIWLYQRKQIRHQLKSTEYADLKHYSIIIVSNLFEVWESSCSEDGYAIRRLDKGLPLDSVEGVRRYVEWNNAIHSWGLGPHASAFRKDAEAFLQQKHDEYFPTPPSSVPDAAAVVRGAEEATADNLLGVVTGPD